MGPPSPYTIFNHTCPVCCTQLDGGASGIQCGHASPFSPASLPAHLTPACLSTRLPAHPSCPHLARQVNQELTDLDFSWTEERAGLMLQLQQAQVQVEAAEQHVRTLLAQQEAAAGPAPGEPQQQVQDGISELQGVCCPALHPPGP